MMSEHDDAIREALAAERAAAHAQLDPEEYEELIAATDAALEARPSLVVRGEEELADALLTLLTDAGQTFDDEQARALAKSLVLRRTVTVAPSLVAESREAVAKALWAIDYPHFAEQIRGVEQGIPTDYLDRADALLAPGGPVRLADATPEQAWDECVAAAKRVKPWSHVPANPYDGFTRKEQNDGE
jgi:hypothetical protein